MGLWDGGLSGCALVYKCLRISRSLSRLFSMISMIEYALYRDDLKLNTQVNGFTKGSPFM